MNTRSTRINLAVYLALLVLLATTYAVAKWDLGRFNLAVSLGVAALKVALVGVFFMHLGFEKGVVRAAAFAGFFWLAVLFTLVFCEISTRGWLG